MLTATEERHLIAQAQASSAEAESKLVLAFEPLARGTARSYQIRAGSCAVDFDDLVQAAREAIVVAARDFDLARVNRFSSFLTYRIRAAIQSALAESEPLPTTVADWRLQRRVAAIAHRQAADGIMPTAQTVGSEISTSRDDVVYHLEHPLHVTSLKDDGQDIPTPLTGWSRQSRQYVAEAAADLSGRLGRVPRPGELAEDLGIDLDAILGALAGDFDDGREVKAAFRSRRA